MGLSDHYIHTVSTTRRADTDAEEDDYGNDAEAWVESIASLPCRIWQKRGGEDHDGRDVTAEDWRLVCAAAADLLRTDRLAYAGRTFEIETIETINAGAAAHHLHAHLRIVA